MRYIKYQPSPILEHFVECYFVWQHPHNSTPIWVDTPPNAFTAFVINLENPYEVELDEKETLRVPKSFISGQSIKNYKLRISSSIHQVGIVFKPTAIFHLFGIPLYEFTNSRLDLIDVIPHHFRYIEEKLHHAAGEVQRIKILDKWLVERLRDTDHQWDGVDISAQEIISKYGNVQISDLLENAFMSRRKFERHFLTRVGLSPKYYARIRRYGYLCSQIAGQRTVNWNQILYSTGYYDQSHFIKDFKEFSGKSPSQYIASNNELAHRVEVQTENLRVK